MCFICSEIAAASTYKLSLTWELGSVTSRTCLLLVLHIWPKLFALPHLRHVFPVAGQEFFVCILQHLLSCCSPSLRDGNPFQYCWHLLIPWTTSLLDSIDFNCDSFINCQIFSLVYQFLSDFVRICAEHNHFRVLTSLGSLKAQSLASSFKSVRNCSTVSFSL